MAGMIVGQFVSEDLDLSGATAFLDIFTKSGKKYAADRFTQPATDGLINIQLPIINLRKRLRNEKSLEKSLMENLTQIASTEAAIDEIINTEEQDKRITETTEQVYWKPDSFGSQVNAFGVLIEIIIFWKTIFMPGFAIVTPLLVIILPYILLRVLFGITIDASEYVKIIQNLVLSNTPTLNIPGTQESQLTMLSKYAYILMSVGVFISNIWNQVQSAIHLRAVAQDIRERGSKILDYVKASKNLATLLNDTEGVLYAESIGFKEDTLSLGAYGMLYNNSRNMTRLREWVSVVDLQIGLARKKGICFPKAVKDADFQLDIEGLYHPGVPFGKRVLNNISFGKDTNNILITGPNRGGKSTLCKSIGFALMCAQSWGIAFAKKMRFVPVSRFETALAPADTLGRLSLFEAEIEFAKHLLAVAEKARAVKEDAPVFIIMDEIFHSTNAHDGAEASLIFLNQLYTKGNRIGSLISTHYRELPDKLKVRNYCMEAFDNGVDGIKYTYKCIPGISVISSVKEILKERGLLSI
jgi:hypothetical protein